MSAVLSDNVPDYLFALSATPGRGRLRGPQNHTRALATACVAPHPQPTSLMIVLETPAPAPMEPIVGGRGLPEAA